MLRSPVSLSIIFNYNMFYVTRIFRFQVIFRFSYSVFEDIHIIKLRTFTLKTQRSAEGLFRLFSYFMYKVKPQENVGAGVTVTKNKS